MTNSRVQIGIVHYPGALLSAVQGLTEQFYLANTIAAEYGYSDIFQTQICDTESLNRSSDAYSNPFNIIILPPCLDDSYYLAPDETLITWIKAQHGAGAIICSVCAGAFVLAETGLIDNRCVTTHWALSHNFGKRYPSVSLNVDKLLINDMDIITAGGLMSWIDLGLELVAQYTNSHVMRQLGKFLLVDTAPREQRFYHVFKPKLDHGDEAILKAQHAIQKNFKNTVVIKHIAEISHLSERTFLRRFVKATGFKPNQYLQHLRIQKACELIETSAGPFEKVAEAVGYEDMSAFRRIFVKMTGQTPKEFKRRFA